MKRYTDYAHIADAVDQLEKKLAWLEEQIERLTVTVANMQSR